MSGPNVRTPGEVVGTDGRTLWGWQAEAQIVSDAADAGKTVATLRAKLALSGHAVHDLADGGFLVVAVRWGGLCRECPDLAALAAFARMLGVRA